MMHARMDSIRLSSLSILVSMSCSENWLTNFVVAGTRAWFSSRAIKHAWEGLIGVSMIGILLGYTVI